MPAFIKLCVGPLTARKRRVASSTRLAGASPRSTRDTRKERVEGVTTCSVFSKQKTQTEVK